MTAPKAKKSRPLHKKGDKNVVSETGKRKVRVVLCRSIAKLGTIGEFVDVAPGFFRNNLLPKGLALPATSKSVKKVEAEKQKILAQEQKMKEDMMVVLEKLKSLDITIRAKAQEAGVLYGSIHPEQIVAVLKEEGVVLEVSMIEIPLPIKELGHHVVHFHLHPELSFEGKVWVVEE